MTTTPLEMGLVKLQSETIAESNALNGVLDMVFNLMPDAICNAHGMNSRHLTYCVVPDGSMVGEGENLKAGIDARMRAWWKLPSFYKFKRASKRATPTQSK